MKHFLTLIFFLISATTIMAQSSRGDMLYAEGIGLQKVQTITSQKSAIMKFQQAKVAYSKAAKKKECDAQIAACNRNIKRLQEKTKNSQKSKEDNDTLKVDTTHIVSQVEAPAEVKLSVSESRIDFKAQPRENQIVKVSCNYDGWEIASKPEWLKVYVAPGEFSVIAEENQGDDRSGIIEVSCKEKVVRVIVNQSKLKGIKGLLKKIK